MGRPLSVSFDSPPEWVLFDLNGTLLDPAAIAEPLGAAPAVGAEILDQAVAQAAAGTMAGLYRPLPECMRAALTRRARLGEFSGAAVQQALERARALPAFPEAAPALDVLAQAGLRVGVLTNSATEAAEGALAAAGLRDRLELVAGSDEVEAYKPDPRAYANGVARADAAREAIVLVAAHWWDVMGASAFGLRTGWVGHRERLLLDSVPEPHFSGEGLLAVARSIAAAAAPGG